MDTVCDTVIPTIAAANAFVQLTSCVRLPDEYSTADLAAYHASLNGFGEENRDSMGLLAASFTGQYVLQVLSASSSLFF